MVFEIINLAVARELWLRGPQDPSHRQFFFAQRAGLQPHGKTILGATFL